MFWLRLKDGTTALLAMFALCGSATAAVYINCAVFPITRQNQPATRQQGTVAKEVISSELPHRRPRFQKLKILPFWGQTHAGVPR
jgi:hypothetical protein